MSQPSLGTYLRQERERKGITIEQVASATKVSVRLLHALEADQYTDLPAAPFVRGFVTSFCRFVGMDDKDVLTRYRLFISEKALERPSREGGHSGYAFDRQGEERSRALLWMAMTGLVVLGGVTMVFLKPALKHRRMSQLEPIRAVQPAKSAPAAAVVSEQVAPTSPAPLPVAAPVAAPQAPAVPPAPPAPAADGAKAPTTTTANAEVVASSSAKSQTAAQVLGPFTPATLAAADRAAREAKEPSVDQALEPEEKDPLRKGDDLNPQQVGQKAVFRSLENIWVRYQIDDREPHQFMLLKDKQLVIKAERQILFQVSNPRSIELRDRTGSYRPVASSDLLVERNDTSTLVFPRQEAEKIDDPFPGKPALPATPSPGEATESQDS
ncbi:MAG: helix-turn-helix domain-containing protein [Bdellovibrionales bacterium]|nr:helix-turn-helix domain-containing protein [Bdellovibrionales bacterium]